MQKEINITSKKMALILVAIIACLLTANLLIIYLHIIKGFQHLRGFIHGFYFDAEANFPSLYSALAIALSAYLLWMIGSLQREKMENRSMHWKFLSIVFVLLAMDEFGSLHEYLIMPLRGILDRSAVDSGYLYFAWFIPYIALAIVLALVFFRFFLRLPLQTRALFVVAAVVFISGAVGMEMVGGKYWAEKDWNIDGSDAIDVRYALIITIEELLEMLGVVIFIYALTNYYLKARSRLSFVLTFSDK